MFFSISLSLSDCVFQLHHSLSSATNRFLRAMKTQLEFSLQTDSKKESNGNEKTYFTEAMNKGDDERKRIASSLERVFVFYCCCCCCCLFFEFLINFFMYLCCSKKIIDRKSFLI